MLGEPLHPGILVFHFNGLRGDVIDECIIFDDLKAASVEGFMQSTTLLSSNSIKCIVRRAELTSYSFMGSHIRGYRYKNAVDAQAQYP